MLRLQEPLDRERREGIKVLVVMRWMLIGAALFVIDYRPGTPNEVLLPLNGLVIVAAILNSVLQVRLVRRASIPTGLPLIAGAYDAIAITGAMWARDGFDNQSYLLYYPALLAFAITFPGWRSLVYCGATTAAYTGIVVLAHPAQFDGSWATDQKALALRLTTMVATVVAANMVVRIEVGRRRRAVEAEADRQQEVMQLQQEAAERERAGEEERRRLSREIHDGVSQGVYMLALGLETLADARAHGQQNGADGERLEGLLTLARHTLLDTRGLLFDLSGVMAGETSLAALVENQASEFRAVTGVKTEVMVEGTERPLSPATVGEVYRVLQESLANVYKHAHAGLATIRLTYGEDAVVLAVADDGGGFDDTAASARGNGLRNMGERAAKVGGSLSVAAAAGRGTSVTVRIPYEEGSNGPDSRVAG
ncbi:MAG: sensor histidine kinase [Tepidiformaceae bacterium]